MEIRAKNEIVRLILQAASDGNIKYLDTVSNHALRTAVCSSGCTALHWGAGNNQVQVLEYLHVQRKVVFQGNVDVPAIKKSLGRTPLHYSCRNGCLEASQWLVKQGAQVNSRAKHGITPFQLAVWQNQLTICQWLVEQEKVDPCQVNDFNCGAVHWLGTCPVFSRGKSISRNTTTTTTTTTTTAAPNFENHKDRNDLLPLARWLSQRSGISFHSRQRHGHTPLHKAAWGGHLELIVYLKDQHGLLDNLQDNAGNFAADVADMAHTPRHDEIAQYLRKECSNARASSCAILGIEPTASRYEIRKAYIEKAKIIHPDRKHHILTPSHIINTVNEDNFDVLYKAYIHLIEENGRGNQSNPAHSLDLMLQMHRLRSATVCEPEDKKEEETHDSSFFKARIIAVLLEYGEKGLDLSNVKKKWKQVWPTHPFPLNYNKNKEENEYNSGKKKSFSDFLTELAGDVIEIVKDGKGSTRVYAKNCSQAMVAEAAARTRD